MRTSLNIFGFTILVTMFYWYVGQQVPQKETYPPETTEIRADMSVDEMVKIGEEIVGSKGTCLTCHTIGSTQAGRFPDLANIGANAATRKEGYSAVDYLAESIYEPNDYIVEGYLAGMPVINRPPIKLSDQEILTVIAYLQSLGSTPTVDMSTKLKYATEPQPGASVAASSSATSNLDGPGLFNNYACMTCHRVDAPDQLVGPSLYDVGKRLNKAAIYESILEPNATIARGFQKDVMKTFLDGLDFYNSISSRDLKVLVDYLASLKGN